MTQQQQKLSIELGPLVIFFAASWFAGIYWAIGLFMAATALSLVLSWVLHKKVPPMLLVGAAIVGVFGAAAFYFGDASIFKIKVTLANIAFGVVLLGGLVFGRLFLKMVMGEQIKMREEGWRKLTLRTGLFFFAVAALNELVWRTQTDTFWAGFKLALLPLTLIFFAAQTPMLMKHMIEDEAEPPAP